MKARWCRDAINLNQAGDYAVENEAESVSKTLTVLCPSCLMRSRSSVGIVQELPLTLSGSFLCSHCYADFDIHDGCIEPVAGTLPPWVRWESECSYETYKYR